MVDFIEHQNQSINCVEYRNLVAQTEYRKRYRKARCRWATVTGLLCIVLDAGRDCTWRRARYGDRKRCDRSIVVLEYQKRLREVTINFVEYRNWRRVRQLVGVVVVVTVLRSKDTMAVRDRWELS